MSMRNYANHGTALVIREKDFPVIAEMHDIDEDEILDFLIDEFEELSKHQMTYLDTTDAIESLSFTSQDDTVAFEDENCLVIFTYKVPDLINAPYKNMDELLDEFLRDDAIPDELVTPERIGYISFVTYG